MPPLTNDEESAFVTLKAILLADERAQIHRLEKTLFNKEALSQQVQPIVEERFVHAKANFDEEFGRQVDRAIVKRLEDSKEQLLEVIYPVLGQMIRKYVAYQFQLLKERIDQQLQTTFSFRVLVRRFRSQVLGIADSDVVLSQLDVPEIEEMFLIQSESGLLLGSYSRNAMLDRDLVAGMLTAIKSFVEDAFQVKEQQLELIEYGNYKIFIQNFYNYYAAVVISGSLSSAEKDTLGEKLLVFANTKLKLNMSVVTSTLTDTVSKRLEAHFKENAFVKNKQ